MIPLNVSKAVGVLALCLIQASPVFGQSATRFVAVEVYLESQQSVAAWQIEFSTNHDNARIVGVENGDSTAFGDAPYYDKGAIAKRSVNRVIVADFSLHPQSELPQGHFRITTLHLIVKGDTNLTFETRLVVATDYQGSRIHPTIRAQLSTGSTP